MTILPLLFWIILVLALIFGMIPPTSWPYAPRITNLVLVVELIIIGLKLFKIPIQ